MSRASRRTLVSHKLRDFSSGDHELDKQINEHVRDFVAQIFEKIRYFDKYTLDNELTSAEITAGVTPINFTFPPGDIRRYGANTTPGTTDMTAALVNCYAACKATGGLIPMRLQPEVYLFTTRLDWDGSVDVLGSNSEFTILRKSGGIDGIAITGVAQQSEYADFTIDAINDAATAFGRHGITVQDAAHLTMQRVAILNHHGHGLYLVNASPSGFGSHYNNITCVGNGGDGVRIDGHYDSYFTNLDLRGNTGWGLKVLSPSAYHSGKNVICQQNTAGGAEIAGLQNAFEIYGESNTGTDISLTAASVRNLITNLHIDSYPSDLADLGTNNIILSISGSSGVMTSSVSRPKRTTNVVGLDIVVSGGAAGAGAGTAKGGTASVFGGDSDGTGNLNGGDVILRGGSGIGTGIEGDVILQPGTGDIKIGVALVALGGGAAPTLGTIGGSGPATAAQNKWIRVKDSAGAAMWIPVWK